MKELDGYTRVTEVLETYANIDSIPDDILQRAADRGTYVHKICEAHLMCMGVPEIDSEYAGYVDSFLNWRAKQGEDAEFIFLDRFFDEKLKITGECDCVMIKDGKSSLIDFKTSYKESKTWALQGAAYAYLMKNAGMTADEILFIHLIKDGSDAVVFNYEYKSNKELFFKALDLHRYFNPPKRKRKKKVENEQ